MPKVVVIGAGIVGTSLADELTARGWTDVTVLDRGPLFATGGSTSHAPGLVFQTNPSKTMSAFAALHRREVRRPRASRRLGVQPGRRARGRHHAGTLGRSAPQGRLGRGLGHRRATAHRRPNASSCTRCSTATASSADSTRPTDGLAKAVRAAEAQARRADRPRRDVPCRTPRCSESSRRAAASPAYTPTDGVIDADIVVCAAGFWGAQFAKQVGLVVPLVPMAHQYARTGQIAALVGRNTELSEAGLPILRHQDQDLYFREHVDRIGIGSYGHRPMPVDMSTLMADTAGEPMPSMLPFTEEDFAPAWHDARRTASRTG